MRSIAAGGPAYTYLEIAGINNQDGGVPNGNIRPAFLYDSARVALADSETGVKGSAVQAVEVVYTGAATKLSVNPGAP